MSESTEKNYAVIKDVLKKASSSKKVATKDVEAAVSQYNEMVKELEHLKKLSSHQDTQSLEQIKMLQEENKDLKDKILNLNSQIDELRQRLSKLAGQKLVDGNPDIADLSDPYRPTNLGEKFHQAYDDEWTTAYEFLDKTHSVDQPKIIDFLANIVKEIDQVCTKTGEDQISKIRLYVKDDIVSPKLVTKDGTMVAQKRSAMDKKQEELVNHLLSEFRKSFGILSVKPLAELFDKYYMEKVRSPWKIPSTAKELNAFVEKCLEIIWLMKIQHPPMKLVWLYEGEKCDKNKFAFYTKRGENVKQTVWPAVLLHNDGPLVAKGVVQGT